jgi:drug/metabolite transporter (DMT)-like permease
MACGEVVAAATIMLPIYFLSGAEVPTFADSAGGGWIITSLIGLFMLDTYLYFESLRLSGPIVTAAGNYVMILAGVTWGVMLLGETVPRRLWGSLILVLMALILLQSGPRKSVGGADFRSGYG